MNPLKPSEILYSPKPLERLEPYTEGDLNTVILSWNAEAKSLSFKAMGFNCAFGITIATATIIAVGAILSWAILGTMIPFHWEVTILIAVAAGLPAMGIGYLGLIFFRNTAETNKENSQELREAATKISTYIELRFHFDEVEDKLSSLFDLLPYGSYVYRADESDSEDAIYLIKNDRSSKFKHFLESQATTESKLQLKQLKQVDLLSLGHSDKISFSYLRSVLQLDLAKKEILEIMNKNLEKTL